MNVDRIYEDYKVIPLQDDDKIFIEGYLRAIDDVESFFANRDIYDGLDECGFLGVYLDMEKPGSDGSTWEEYLQSCIEDWLVSQRKQIEISMKDQYED